MSDPPTDKEALGSPLGRGVRQWLDGWPDFQEQHGEWLGTLRDPDVLYVLEPELIEFLKTPKRVPRPGAHSGDDLWRELPALLSEEQAEAERALHDLCADHRPDCVGVAYGAPVLYTFLGAPLPYPEMTEDDIDALEWTGQTTVPCVKKTFTEAAQRGPEIQARLTAYAGWLIGNRVFRDERDALRASWQELSEEMRTTGPFALPLGRLNYLTKEQRTPYAEVGGRFLERLEAFLARWSLTHMRTWDLPSPQGPLFAMPAPVVERLTGRTPVIDYYPPFYPVPSDHNLHQDVRDAQEREARELGLPGEFPPVKLGTRRGQDQELEEAGYATALRVYFAELAFRRRYGDQRGLRTRLQEFLQDEWGLSDKRIRQIRKLYAGAMD